MDIKETNFLKKLDENKNKNYYARISVLDMDENIIQSIEGRVLPGSSVSIAGNSSVRRTCSLNLVAEKEENDLTDINNLLAVNKKIKIYVGLEKDLDYLADVIYLDYSSLLPEIGEIGKIYISREDLFYRYWTGSQYITINTIFDYQKDIVWFPMGVYVIVQPNIVNEPTNCNISLACKDKMALLNGEMGGNLPTSITFHEYDQVIGNIDIYYNSPGEIPFIGDLVTDPNEYNVYTYHYNYNKITWDKKYKWTRKYGWEDITESDSSTDFYAGKVIHIRNLIYDIIQTSVANFGNESLAKIIINDVPKEIKQIVRYIGSVPLYYNTATNMYTLDENYIISSQEDPQDTWRVYEYNDDIGYVYTNFVMPEKESIITNIGDNVCTVLDKIANFLGNYEYFYDIDGNFIFQEKRNYLNNSYNPTKEMYNAKPYYLDNNKDGVNGGEAIQMSPNDLKLIGKENYRADYYSDQKSVYTFNQGNGLITSYNNTPNYTNLKNDYHIWGKNANNNNVIHYHVVIKNIPQKTYYYNGKNNPPTYKRRDVVFLRDSNNKFTGKIRMLNKDDYTYRSAINEKGTITFLNKIEDGTPVFSYNAEDHSFTINKVIDPDYTKSIVMSNIDGVVAGDATKKQLGVSTGLDLVSYIPSDWRAELYLQGLEAIQQGKRPDIYQQELLDLFDSIYEWGYYDDNNEWHWTGRFKSETVYNPNSLNYWIDFLEPIDNFYGISVDDIEPKLYSHQQDKIVKIYTDEIPNCILIDEAMDDDYQQEVRDKCNHEGQPESTVDKKLYANLAENTLGYSAQEVARNLLYQYTTYNEVISLQSVPIYYLDVNTRITVTDRQSGINGDYIINSINIPLSPTSAMNISASRALNRI